MSVETFKITAKHTEELAQIANLSFFETYANYNTAEDMHLYRANNFSKLIFDNHLKIKKVLIGANYDGKLVGYAQLYDQNTRKELNESAIEIERLYVLKEFQKKNIGALLLHACEEYALQNNYKNVWLGVWKYNTNAIGFYERHGYTIFGEHHFVLGKDVQEDWVMRKKVANELAG